MKRSIDQWKNCNPKHMVYNQSITATQFALEDAKDDILELYKENMRLRNIARIIAFPCRGTSEESYSLLDMAKLIQSVYTADDLWVPEKDR